MTTALQSWLLAELEWLDILLHREILRMRGRYQLSLDEFRGLYVSDCQVDALIAGHCAPHASVHEMSEAAEKLRTRNARARPPEWARVQTEFALSEFELDVLLVAIARELHLKYDTIYAYVNNDITRKKPTRELVLRLFGQEGRDLLLPEAVLFRDGLLQDGPDTHFLGRELVAELPAMRYLTGLARESSVPATPWPQEACRESFARASQMKGLFVIDSPDQSLGQAMAEAACAAGGRRLLTVDLGRTGLDGLARRIRLIQRLENCALCVTGTQALWGPETLSVEGRRFCEDLAFPCGPVWVVFRRDASWRTAMTSRDVRVLSLAEPDVPERRRLWREALPHAEPGLHDTLAARFMLGAGEIRASVAYAYDALHLRGEERGPYWEDMLEAIRWQSDAGLGRLAQRLACRQTWDDLVLPAATLRQVREAAGAIRFHQVVYADWGFGRKHTSLEGIKIMFAGPSGTGKTMTAGVVGRDLGLDVYRVDLSSVVSKYIGETEKNLDKVFRAAQHSNTILFFDEADALFGKRSEVKDAHDRYANIEVAYLLQKLEDHDGPVILATNLRRNIDDAFSRRIHYSIEFPEPDEDHRKVLWRKIFPPQTPLGPDVDLNFLATQFPITGGDIRNVALHAAFLAAQDGGAVTMRHLAAAMAQQIRKQGRVPTAVDFREFHAMILKG